MTNHKEVLLVSYPINEIQESNFKIIEKETPKVTEGKVLIQNLYISVDPYMRGFMSPNNKILNYAKPYELDKPVSGGSIGKIVESQSDLYKPGDLVYNSSGWVEKVVVDATSIRKVDQSILQAGYSPSTALGVFGMPGLTAYFGLLEVGGLKDGETVLVSAAAGAVGSLVVQIAKIKGCKVVGTTSSDEKCEFVKSLGADFVINYTKSQNLYEDIKKVVPEGIDVYFDNVGGETLIAAVKLLRNFGRIALCGAITEYNSFEKEVSGPSLTSLVGKQGKIEGFLNGRFSPRNSEGIKALVQWAKEGKLKFSETVSEGIDSIPNTMIMMMKGKGTGKFIVKL